jgi:hypothetical protein
MLFYPPPRSRQLSQRKMRIALSFAALSALSATLPARAGVWYVTVTGPATATTSPSATPSANGQPASGGFSVTANYSISTGAGQGPGQPVSASVSVQCPLHVAVAWQPNGSLASDPEPATVRLTESGLAAWSATGSNGTTAYTTGSGSASFAGLAPGTVQYSTTSFTGLDHQIQAQAASTCSPPATQSGSASAGASFTYSVRVSSVSASLTVDQDQQVFAPAATTRFSATISSPSGFTVDSVKISVDGTPATATVNPNNANNYYIDWPQTGGNPSEHTVTATAQIHDSIGAITLNSLDAPNRSYNTSGMGRPADIIIANLQLQSLTFNKSIPMRYSASANPAPSPDPALVPTPQLDLSQTGAVTASLPPMAYVQGTSIPFTIQLYPLTGNATVGYTLDLNAKPLATNEAGLVLYHTGTVPQPFTNSLSLTSQAALYKEVNDYATTLDDLRFWVQFTKSTGNWAIAGDAADTGHQISNQIYAPLATPAAPMAQPWVGVLTYACQYAAGTASATAATSALTSGLYNNGRYNGGYRGYTDGGKDGQGNTIGLKDGYEELHVQGFINAQLTGQCDDFADFLVFMSNSIGALPLQSRRSASVAETSAGSSFTTKNITWSPVQSTTATGTPVTWSYHQWTTSNVYDGCLKFSGTTSPINMMLPDYFSALVATIAHANQSLDWDPQTPFNPDPEN